jgi:hypothetical protein
MSSNAKCANPMQLLLLVLKQLTLDDQWDFKLSSVNLHAYVQICATKMQMHIT